MDKKQIKENLINQLEKTKRECEQRIEVQKQKYVEASSKDEEELDIINFQLEAFKKQKDV